MQGDLVSNAKRDKRLKQLLKNPIRKMLKRCLKLEDLPFDIKE